MQAAASGPAASARGTLAAPAAVVSVRRKQQASRRSFHARLRAHAESGPGQERVGLDAPTGVFPRARAREPIRQASAPAACPLAVERAAGRPGGRFSAIDGLPLPSASRAAVSAPTPPPPAPARAPAAAASPLRRRSRSRSARLRQAEASEEETAAGALYFVDSLTHRTHAECAACGLTLGTPSAAPEGGGQRCVLGFRPAGTLSGGAGARWLHAEAGCLAHLGLPPAGPCASDVVFSPEVAESSRASVLQDLAEAAAMGAAQATARASRVSAQRWSYPVARAQRWGQRRSAASARSVGGGPGGSQDPLAGLQPSRLEERELASISDCSGGTPLCVICMEDLAVGVEVLRLPCAHIFHADCAGEWLRQRPVCPLDLLPVAAAA